MKLRILLTVVLLASLTACGQSQDSKIVYKNPENGETQTYAEVRDFVAEDGLVSAGQDCATFAASGVELGRAEYPAGQAAFVAACEEGLKQRKP